MINLKKLLVVGAMAATIGLTNVNAASYIGTKKYSFQEFDITNELDYYSGFYEYKGDLFVVGNDDKSYKITSGDKLKLEVSDKTYNEHLYELYPNTVLTSFDYSGVYEGFQTIGQQGSYINGTPFGAGGQHIEGIPTNVELYTYEIINNKIYLYDMKTSEEIEGGHGDVIINNFYIVNSKDLTLEKTIKSSDVARAAGIDTTKYVVQFMPLKIDDNTEPYFMAVNFEIIDEEIIIGKDVTIMDSDLNKIVSFNTEDKEIYNILAIKNGEKFLIELEDLEKDIHETKVVTKDGNISDFKISNENQYYNIETDNGFVILYLYEYSNGNSTTTLYDEELNKIKTYKDHVSIHKVVNDESDIANNFVYNFNFTALFGKETQSVINSDKYFIYSYEDVETCNEDQNCYYETNIKSMELLTVEDSKKVNVTGILKDKDGNPLKDYTVELHSTVRTTKTDKNGYFKFDNVEEGKHTLIIKDDKGTTLATKEINVIYGEETKLDGDTLTFNEKDNGVNINLKLDGENLSIASVDKGVTVPKTFDTLTNSIILLITLTLSTLFIIKKSNKIKYLKRVNS